MKPFAVAYNYTRNDSHRSIKIIGNVSLC